MRTGVPSARPRDLVRSIDAPAPAPYGPFEVTGAIRYIEHVISGIPTHPLRMPCTPPTSTSPTRRPSDTTPRQMRQGMGRPGLNRRHFLAAAGGLTVAGGFGFAALG